MIRINLKHVLRRQPKNEHPVRHFAKKSGSGHLIGWVTPMLLCICVSMMNHGAVADAATRRALLIGIGAYAPPPGASLPKVPGAHGPDSRFAPGTTWTALKGPLVDVAGMQFLLTNQFGFPETEVRVLDQQQATRRGILAAIDKLVAETRPGDFVVFYYAGHGSRRLDSLSSKNHFDETIVPVDAWTGSEDIRDKELATRFNQIVYDKHAHLTAIFDSCNSGTMARGITQTTTRSLPYDDRDVADEKHRDPNTIVESDLKRRPQDGDAIIIAAAASNESASEGLYLDDLRIHGAFTRALVRVLGTNTQPLSAVDVIAQAGAVMHADPGSFQQPSVEGRVAQSLFGDPVAPHNLHAHVIAVTSDGVTLDLGSAAAFDVGTEFTALDAAADGTKTRLRVTQVNDLTRSTAIVSVGPPAVSISQTFELTRMVYPEAARMQLFLPPAESDPLAAVAAAKEAFPQVTWVMEPQDKPIQFVVYRSGQGFRALDQNHHELADAAAVHGNGFLLLGPPAAVQQGIEQSVPFENHAFTVTTQLSRADYVMTMRQHPDGTAEVSLLDPIALSDQERSAWVRGPESDTDEAALNGGTAPDIVCRNEVTSPVRTAWLPVTVDQQAELTRLLIRRIFRLGKLRTWLKTPELVPGLPGWPYHLQVTTDTGDGLISGPLALNQRYQVRLVTTADARASNVPIPRYVYVLGFDCSGNSYLLYPTENLNGDATVPQPGAGGVYPLSVFLGVQETVGLPLGADTLFLLVTSDKLTGPGVLLQDGELQHASRGASANRFDELVTQMNDATTRSPRSVPSTWTVQQLVLPSR